MIDHVGLHVGDIGKSKSFYDTALAPLGYALMSEFPQWKVVGYGWDGKPDFWLTGDGAEKASHVAFMAKDKPMVEAFYQAGLTAGGTDNGGPGYRKDYGPGYYAAFVRDPDGHNIEAVFHDPSPSE